MKIAYCALVALCWISLILGTYWILDRKRKRRTNDKCRSNAQWCREEVERLEAKGIHARIVHDESGMIAVIAGMAGE